MEGNIRLPRLRSAEFAGCPTVLTLSNSEDVLRLSDDCRAWTDEKHNLFLNQLEVSFVSQLHQSKCIVGKCHELNKRDTNKSQKLPNEAHNSSGKFTVLRDGCWQNIKCERDELLSHTSANFNCRLHSPWVTHIKRLEKDCHPPSADIDKLFKLSGTNKQRKGVICHGMATYSQLCSTSNLYNRDSFDVTTAEGTGQNFLDEENQSKSDIEPLAKRLWKASASTPILDQIVLQEPSNNKLFSS